jgi:hypothetical protein
MEEPIYRCAQDEFYLAAFLMLNSLEDDLEYFVLHKPKYTIEFVDALRQELINSELMPDNEQRTEPVKRLRNALVLKTDGVCTQKLQALKSYIHEAYPNPVDAQSAIEEAGFNKYIQATHYDWEALRNIFTTANTFITDNSALLQANNNMPPTFPGSFQTLKDEIHAEINIYTNRKENTKQGTHDKNVVNNAIYRKLMQIGEDGQVVWINDETRAQQYIWYRILEVVTPPGAAGLRGTVKDQGDFLPVIGAQIIMQKQGSPPVTFITNQTGRYDSGNLPIGIYSIKINSPGFSEIESQIEIKLGVISYKHWLMIPGNAEVQEGGAAQNEIKNVTIPPGVNDDTTIKVEAFGSQMQIYASATINGEITGTGALYVNIGAPLVIKWNQLIAQIGLDAANSFLNIKNVGASSGAWKITFIIA